MGQEIYMGGDYSTAQTLIILDKVAERRRVYGKQKGSKNGALRDATTPENRKQRSSVGEADCTLETYTSRVSSHCRRILTRLKSAVRHYRMDKHLVPVQYFMLQNSHIN